ncbi:MAG: hypothetical protein J0L57_04180, partial [Burkholderiales bacterium]|nr:hypothetical protein [Burkholderiales bacterium]
MTSESAATAADGNTGCGDGPHLCAFAKALLAQQAACERACRRSVGERSVVDCGSPVALTNCRTLAALLRE